MKSAILLAVIALFLTCRGQEFAFPGLEEEDKPGQQPMRFSDKRIPLLIPGACPPNQLLFPGDQQHDWICDCGPGYIYYPPKDGCFSAYKRGPCEEEQYLILPPKKVIPECRSNPCKTDGFVRFNGKCYELGKTGGPCKPASEGGGELGVNATTLELQCLETNGEELSLINFPPNCPKGSRRGATHCRQEYRRK
ncbi:hypothetical protein FQR65_LT01551 [Abscondita terminalis]|nr:hypothetical protein FQR65_LT01551 [Abscondita terminalis]